MTGLCLGLAGVIWATLPAAHFTLAWTHSVERIRWEEDYSVTPQGLLLGEARVQGSGAGMEIPADARLVDGRWRYRRQLPPLRPLQLGRTPQAGDYQLCLGDECAAMSHWIGPPDIDRPWIELWPCEVY